MGKQLLKIMCVLLLLSMKMQAAHVTPERAQGLATSFCMQQGVNGLRGSVKPTLRLVYQATSTLRSADSSASFYVFNLDEGKGFVIVSADDRTYPVLGYSDQGSFDYDRIPDAMKELLGKYEKEIQMLATQKASSPEGVATEWNRLQSMTKADNSEKLLKTALWNQDYPFNNQCPNRRLVGCVGTAMGIIMQYNKWPEKGNGSHTSNGNTVTFGEYNWASMPATGVSSAAQIAEVSKLLYDAAVSIDTEFGLYSSSSGENRVPLALTSYFGYDRGIEYKKKDRMVDADWADIIRKEIDNNRPVLYAGQDASAGHAFVCDGYNSDGKFHINWGWGGYMNAYFSLSLLNPKTYNYSSMEAMVYNIKRASNATAYSPLQLTSEEKQVGLTSDKENIVKNETFSVWAGAIKNTTYEPFNGKIVVVLTDKNGKIKDIVSDPVNLGLQSLEYKLSWQFNTCRVKNVDIEEGDLICLATKAGQEDWKLISGSLIAADSAKAKGNKINYFQITFPRSVAGQVTIKEDDKVVQAGQVIQGRNYAFKIIPNNTGDVIYVKANGYRLTPADSDQTLYNLNTVVEDKQIEITVIGADQIKFNKALWIEAGGLERALTNEELGTVKNLTLFGTMDSRDFATIKNKMKLSNLDISTVTIIANGGNPANAIPLQALEGYASLESIQLPQSITKICHNAFAENRKLKEITLPASLSTYEYNLFYYCSSLRKVTVLNGSPKFINWCVFTGTPSDKILVVPNGKVEAFKNAENWKKFGKFEEAPANPQPDSCNVILQETVGLNIFPVTKIEGEKVAPGTNYEFKVEAESNYMDHKLTVYANTTVLKPDQNGVYTISNIKQSTMVHVEMSAPEKVGDSPFTIQGQGMITEITNVMLGKNFNVIVKEIKIPKRDPGFEYERFANISIALTDKEGRIKEIISPQVKARTEGLHTYVFNCVVKESNVIASNQLRVVSNTGSWDWVLLKGEGSAITRIDAVGNEVAYCAIVMPQKLEKASIENVTDRVVKGMDYSFRVKPYNSTDKIDVRVNGNSLLPASGDPTLFLIPSITADQNITIHVYDLNSEAYTTVNCMAGELSKVLAGQSAVKLRIVGEIDQRDFDSIKVLKPVFLDLSDAKIVAYGKNTANVLPTNAFGNVTNVALLKSVILPNNLIEIAPSAFYRCSSLSEITIPENVKNIGLSAFAYNPLTKVTIKWRTPPIWSNLTNIFPSDKGKITLAVPSGCTSLYKAAAVWKEFEVEEYIEHYSVSLPSIPGISITSQEGSNPNRIEAGKPFAFKVATGADFTGHSYDVTVQNSEILKKDANDVYTINKVNSNLSIGIIVYHTVYQPVDATVGISLIPLTGFSLDSVKTGTDCKFIVRTSDAIRANLKVKANDVELASADSMYTIPNVRANQKVTIAIQIPENTGEGLDAGFLAAIDSTEAKTMKELGVSGNMKEEDFTLLKDKFPALQSLDLSGLDNAIIPESAFAGMDSLKMVELPAELTEIKDNVFNGCKSLETIVMKSNLRTVGSSVFSGCINLNSIVFSNSVVCAADAFKDMNPNCIVLEIDTKEPEASHGRSTLRSEAGRHDRILLAQSTQNGYLVKDLQRNIELKNGFSYSSPATIELASGNYIMYTRTFSDGTRAVEGVAEITDWKTISLPFNVGKVMSGSKVLEAGKDYQLQQLTEEGFVKSSAIKRDIPYIISAKGTLTFYSEEKGSLQNTPKEWSVVKGKEFDMKPTYSIVAKNETVYAVNGLVFQSNLRDIEPFESYVVMIGGESVYDIIAAEGPGEPGVDPEEPGKPEVPTDVDAPNSGEMQVHAENGQLMIQAYKEEVVSIYNFAGRLVHQKKLSVGSNHIALPSGAYIVKRKKISF